MHPLLKTWFCGLAVAVAATGSLRADEILRKAQQSLRDQGFYYGSVDGTPGDETTQAIRRYQIRNGLAVTGALNDETQQNLAKTGAPAAARPRPTTAPIDEDRRYANEPTPPPRRSSPVAPPPPMINGGDEEDADDAPAPSSRPDLRVAPGQRVVPGGVRPSATLTSLLESTPFEFAPPPVQTDVVRRAQITLMRGGFYGSEPDGAPGEMTISALAEFQSAHDLRRTGRLDVSTLAEMRLLPGRRLAPEPPPRRYPPVFEGRIVR